MAQASGRLTESRKRAFVDKASETVAEIDAKEFQRARRDPSVRRFAAAADERLKRLRAAGQID